jgi:hypothetical protein
LLGRKDSHHEDSEEKKAAEEALGQDPPSWREMAGIELQPPITDNGWNGGGGAMGTHLTRTRIYLALQYSRRP